MKYVKKSILQKVRSKSNGDIYYTYSDWPVREIDGVEFISVSKNHPDHNTYQLHFMRKDWLEYIKE